MIFSYFLFYSFVIMLACWKDWSFVLAWIMSCGCGNSYFYFCFSRYEALYAKMLPESMLGEKFLEKYADHNDPVTAIDSKRNYGLRAAARHPIYENFRVKVRDSVSNLCNWIHTKIECHTNNSATNLLQIFLTGLLSINTLFLPLQTTSFCVWWGVGFCMYVFYVDFLLNWNRV